MRYLSSCEPEWLRGKVAIVRVDINVPIANGEILDESRMLAIKPTIDFLRKNACKVRLLAHFGRPKGKPSQELSLKNLVPHLEILLGESVTFSSEYVSSSDPIVLYENVRFHPGEEQNTPEFAKTLAKLGDFFVNDAFSVSHRAHASTVGVANLHDAFVGHALALEVHSLEALLLTPKRPLIAVIAGAKVSSKIHLVKALLGTCDHVFLGGALANTFLRALGKKTGASMVEEDHVSWARDVLSQNSNLHIPTDVVVADDLQSPTHVRTALDSDIDDSEMIFDIGALSRGKLCALFSQGGTVVWNGPLGAFEYPPFHEGTTYCLGQLAAATRLGHTQSIIGGGETVASAKMTGRINDFSFVSTAGGAFLEWLEGKKLPGLEACNCAIHTKDKNK